VCCMDNPYLLYLGSLHLGRVKDMKLSVWHVHQLLTCTTSRWLLAVHCTTNRRTCTQLVDNHSLKYQYHNRAEHNRNQCVSESSVIQKSHVPF
jgi:hypothetical protein